MFDNLCFSQAEVIKHLNIYRRILDNYICTSHLYVTGKFEFSCLYFFFSTEDVIQVFILGEISSKTTELLGPAILIPDE